MSSSVESLANAAVTGNIEKFKVLLKEDSTCINDCDKFGYSPLHRTPLLVCFERKFLISEMFRFARANALMRYRIVVAARENHMEILKCLKEHLEKLDVEKRNGVTHTPLMTAANAGREEAVRFLIKHLNAKIDVFDENDYTPLHLAAVILMILRCVFIVSIRCRVD
jgi:ankyrin repeat protein